MSNLLSLLLSDLLSEERALLYLQMQFLQETKMELDRKVSYRYLRVI